MLAMPKIWSSGQKAFSLALKNPHCRPQNPKVQDWSHHVPKHEPGSGWDPELLRLELGELKLTGFDLSLTGFGDLELKDLLAERTAGLTDPDDAPAAPEHPVSQTGDLWLLGRHRLRRQPTPR